MTSAQEPSRESGPPEGSAFTRSLDFTRALNSSAARKRRYQHICRIVGLKPADKVLDVGCGAGRSFEQFNQENEITGLDIDPRQKVFQSNFRFRQGNAAFMEEFEDQQFDVVFCIGVLERVIPYENLKRAASEIQRVGKSHVVVVPHILTLIDPHSQLPFGQFSPRNLRRFTRRWELIRSERRDIRAEAEEDLFYLRRQEWQSLFPRSTVVSYSHLALGLVRDFIIYDTRSRFPLQA